MYGQFINCNSQLETSSIIACYSELTWILLRRNWKIILVNQIIIY